MYLLEDRILFDGAAAADVAAAIAEAEAQQEQQEQEDAEQQEQDQQEQTQDSSNDSDDSSSSSDDSTFITDIDALIADAMNSDQQDIRVLIVSQDILDADGLMDAAADSTIVITYDPNTTSLSDLLAQIKESLGEDKADSIAFAVKSTENGDVILSSSSVTSLDSLASDTDQQAFWADLGTILKSEGRVDILSSDLASTEYGMSLIDSLSDLCDADVAVSDNTTGADGDWILEVGSIDLVDLYFDGEKIDAYTDNITIDAPSVDSTNDIAFVDSNLADIDSIISNLESQGISVIQISGDDAIDQITDYLVSSDEQFDSIQIFSHGNDGHFKLGSTTVNNTTVDAYSDQLAAWGDALSSEGDILIYGCDVAANDDGMAMLQKIADFTGADVAASTDTTGFAGNWVLEHQIGIIDTAFVNIDGYSYNLAVYAYYQTVSSGDWSEYQIWQGSDNGTDWTALVDVVDVIPTTGSTITVQNNITISTSITVSTLTVNAGAGITISDAGDLTVDAGGTMTVEGMLVNAGSLVNNGSINNSGSMSGSGTFDFSTNNANTVTYSGGTVGTPQVVISTTYNDLVIDGNASVASATIKGDLEVNGVLNSIDIIVKDDLTVDGTFASTGNTVFSGVTQAVSGTGSITFHDVEFASIVSATMSCNIAVTGDWTNTSGFIHGGQQVTFNGTAAQTINEMTSFHSIVFDNAAGVTLADDISVAGDWTNTSGFTHGGYEVTFDGAGAQAISGVTAFYDVVFDNVAGVTLADDITVAGNWTNTNGFAHGDQQVTFNGTAAQAISGATAFHSIIFNNATGVSLNNDITVAGHWVNTAGFTHGDQQVTFNGIAAQAISGATAFNDVVFSNVAGVTLGSNITVAGDWTNTNGFTHGDRLVTFNGTAAQAISGATAFYSITFNNAAGVTLNDNITVAKNWTNTAGFAHNNQQVTFNGTATQSIIGATDFYDIVFDGTRVSLAADITVAGSWTNTAGFTHGGRQVTFNGGAAQVITGETAFYSVVFNNAAGVTLNEDITVAGDWTNTAGFTHGDQQVTFNGTVAQTIDGVTDTAFYSIVFNNAAGVTLLQDITVAGDWTNTAGFTHGDKQVIFNGTAAQEISGESAFYDIVFGNALGITLADNITVAGHWMNAAGFIHGDQQVTFDGTEAQIINGATTFYGIVFNNAHIAGVSLAADIIVAGNWTNTDGFAHGTQQVTFNGTEVQSVNGATSFYDVIFNNSSITGVSVFDDITVENDMTIGVDRIVSLYGENISINALSGNGTVAYSGDFPQAIANLTYYNLTLVGDGLKTIDGIVTVTHDFVLAEASSALVELTGDLWIAGGTILGTLTVPGAFTNTGVLDISGTLSGAGTYTFNGSGSVTYSGDSQTVINTVYHDLTISGTNTVMPNLLTVLNDFTTNSLSVTGRLYVGSIAEGITHGAAYNIGGDLTVSEGNASVSGAMVVFDNTTVTISDGSLSAASLNIGVTDGAGGAVVDISGGLTLSGTLTMANRVNTISVGGNFSAAAFVAGNGTFIYNGADQTITNFDYYKLVVAGTGTKTAGNLRATESLTFSDDVTVSATGVVNLGTLVHSSTGTFLYSGSSEQTIQTLAYYNLSTSGAGGKLINGNISAVNLNVDSSLIIGGGRTLTITGASSTISASSTVTINGIFINSGTLTNNGILSNSPSGTLRNLGTGTLINAGTMQGGGTFDFDAVDNTVEYTGTGQTVLVTDYYNLTINNTNLNVTGWLSVGTDTGDFNVSGNLSVINGNVSVTAGMVVSGSAAASIGGSLSANSVTVGTGDALVAARLAVEGNLTVTNALTLTNNTLGHSSVTVGGAVSAGSFTANNGAFTYNGADQTIASFAYHILDLRGTGTKSVINLNVTEELFFSNDVTLSVSGTVNINILTHGSRGTFLYAGDAAQQIAEFEYYNLAVANGDKTLAGNVTVTGQFTFMNDAGKVILGNNDLTLNMLNAILGQSGEAGRYFVTSGTGELILDTMLYATPRNVSIGTDTNWNDIQVTGYWNTISLSVANGVTPATTAPLADIVNQTFTVNNSGGNFLLSIVASSAAGNNFAYDFADLYFYNTVTPGWEQADTPTSSGAYYFQNGDILENNLHVTTLNDYGYGSLRNAIAYANRKAGADVITFDQSLFSASGSVSLNIDSAKGEFLITDSLTLVGPGSIYLTIDGGDASQIFIINDAVSGTSISVSISGMTLTDGSGVDGGAIYNNEMLVLSDVVISSSAATNGGGIYNDYDGKLFMSRVVVDGNSATGSGGGIFNNGGQIQAENVTISDNSAGVNGGGLYSADYTFDPGGPDEATYSPSLLLQNVTVNNNQATGLGGGIYSQGNSYFYNVTIAFNSSAAGEGSGLYLLGGVSLADTRTTLLENVTIAYNSGGTEYSVVIGELDVEGTPTKFASLNMFNTIISFNNETAGSYYNIQASDISDMTTSIFNQEALLTLSNTLADNGGWVKTLEMTADPVSWASGDIVAGDWASLGGNRYTTTSVCKPDNVEISINVGGNITTYYLYESSSPTPAENRWYWDAMTQTLTVNFSHTSLNLDANATTNLSSTTNAAINAGTSSGATLYDARGYMRNGTRDIGAYEYQGIVALNVDNGLYYTTIENAIGDASNGQTIELVGTRIKLAGEIEIDDDIIIKGQGSDTTVLDAGDASRIFLIDDSNPDNFIYVRISGMGLTGGAAADGAAIWSSENLLLNGVAIYDNTAMDEGGALYNDGGYVIIQRSDIYNNTSVAGGAIYNSAGTINISESSFYGNTTTSRGGAIASVGTGATLTIESSVFYNNTATTLGGAIYAENKVEFTNSTFTDNTADDGGAIYLSGSGNWKLTNITVAYNSSADGNYAIEVTGGNLFMINGLFVYNSDGGDFDALDLNDTNTSQVSYNIFNSLGNTTAYADIFATGYLADNGGWTKTLALASGSAAIDAGTNYGVPGYDARGYLSSRSSSTSVIRDLGAYEYNGYIGTVQFPNHDTDTTVSISSLQQIDDYVGTYKGHAIVNLVNTRILESGVDLRMWYSTEVTATPRAARNITIYGHVEGGTVLSAGWLGGLFTLRGNTNGASSPAAIMGTLTVSRLTISDTVGATGGVVTGINNDNNVGGFVANEVSFINNRAAGDGGAIYVAKWDKQLSFTLTNCLFANNISGGEGGAIYAGKNVTFNSGTIAYNRAFGDGGAIYILDGATANLSQSTVAFNYASGRGAIYNIGTLGGGGGLNLIAKNRDASSYNGALSGFDYYRGADGKLTHGNNNLVEYQNGTWAKSPGNDPNFFQSANLVPSDKNPDYKDLVGAVDNLFYTGYVSDHGGWINGIQLSAYSIAVDPVSTRSGTDQRGYGANNFRDIGALELNGTYASVGDTNYSSIAAAIAAAAPGATVTVRDVRILEHDIQINKNITLVSTTTAGGDFVRGTTAFIDAQSFGRVFFIGSPDVEATMNNFYLVNGVSLIASTSGVQQAAGNGGAIYNAGTLTATHLSITNSFAQVSGGAIYSSKALSLTTDSSSVKHITVQISDNRSGLYGGAVYASGTLSISGAKIDGKGTPIPAKNMYNFWYNSASSGGAIYASNASDNGEIPAFKGVYLRGNTTFSDGGALYVDGGNGITIGQSYLLYNTSMSKGGAIYQTSSDLTIYDTTIDANFSFGDGGAIYFNGGNTASMTIYATEEATNKFMNISNNISISGDGGAIYMINAQNLNIYSEVLIRGVNFTYNRTFDGDGGAIYFTNSNNIIIGREGETANNVNFIQNWVRNDSDKGHGGAIYMSNSVDLSMWQNVYFQNNEADVSGGAIYVINSNDIFMREHITIANNWALYGHGGGMYFENVNDITLDYLELANNIAGGENSSATLHTSDSNGGGVYAKNVGDISLFDVDAYDNIATLNGGALYITDSPTSTLTIKASSFDGNKSSVNNVTGRGGAVYATALTTVLIENATFAYNNDTAFHINSLTGTITVKYATFARNTGATSGVSGMNIVGGTMFMSNSIIYETSNAPISGTFAIGSSSNNIFYRFDQFAGTATGLAGAPNTTITAYNEGGGVGGSAQVRDANKNIVGSAGATDTFIAANLYLADNMMYHANYITRALALESRDSIAYHYKIGATEHRAGASDITVKYDQRGNLRSGVTINTADDGAITYVYYEYDATAGKWQQVTVNESGVATFADATNVYTSIGAFEPNFYIVVTTNSDNSSNPEFVIHTKGNVWHDFDMALIDSTTGGLTLREAIYWIDSYTLGSTANSSNDFSEDGSRYVKFADSMFSDGRNIITLNSNAQYIAIRNDVLVGMIDNYSDGTNTYSFFKADKTFMGQDEASRITISGGNHSRILSMFSMEDYSNETGNWKYSAKVGFNNITFTDGLEDGTGRRLGDGDGLGGAIYNEGTLTLHNVMIKNSEASNVNISTSGNDNRSNTGLGGGIYSIDTDNDVRSGLLYIFDSTIDNNIARGTAKNDKTIYVAQGGGIYVRSGVAEIVRSTISSNETWGFAWPNDQALQQINSQGGGLYVYGGTVSVLASTITDNATFNTNTGTSSAYGDGIYQNSGTLTLNSNTIAYNRAHQFTNGEGYAVWLAGGTSTITNNIIANNYVNGLTENVGRDIYAYGNVTDNRNIIGSFVGYNFNNGRNIMGNNQSGAVDNLNLSDQLKYNGGMTKNYRLGADSVAIDTGDAATVTTYDQRGMDRTIDGAGGHSAGSYELLKTIVAYTNVADEALADGDIKYDYSFKSGGDSGRFGWETNLRNALYLADQGATATIHVADEITTVNLATGAGALLIFNDVTVVSTGGPITINAANGGGEGIASRAFIIDGSNFEVVRATATNVTINGFNITNTQALSSSNSGHGGAIYSRGHLTFKNGDISTFSAEGNGGAIYITGGNLTIQTVQISAGSAAGHGGAIFIDSGSILAGSTALTIDGTTAGGFGGGIYISNANQTFSLTNSSISNATASAGSGGGIYYTGENLSFDNVTLHGNTATSTASGGSGGGLYAEISGTATIENSTITANTASNLGGGLYVSSGSLVLTDSTVGGATRADGNKSSAHGGGIYVINGGLTSTNSSILNNTATGNGGGIYVAGSSVVTINTSTVGMNEATGNGGGVFANVPNFDSTNSTYSQNESGALGGGIYFSNPGAISLTYVTVANNISGTVSTTNTDGGGIYVNRGTLNMINTIVAQNYTGSINPANHNDLYFGNLGVVGDVTYSIIGMTNKSADMVDVADFNYVYNASTGRIFDSWAQLGLGTELEDNGGTTKTLYVYNGSIAIGGGIAVAGITTDQRGVTRTTFTIGAYEKPDAASSTYYYKGSGDVNDHANWFLEDGISQLALGGFSMTDNMFVFDSSYGTYAGGLTTTVNGEWIMGSKTTLKVVDIAVTIGDSITVSGVLNAIETAGSMTVAGTFTQLISNVATELAGAFTVSNTGDYTATGEFNLADGAVLTLASLSVSGLNIGSSHANSTVAYTYAGAENQAIKTVSTGNYGNLIIGGTGTGAKTYTGNLDLDGNLTFATASDTTLTVTGGHLLVSGNVVGNNAVGKVDAVNGITINGAVTGFAAGSEFTTPDTITIAGNVGTLGTASAIDMSAQNIFISNAAGVGDSYISGNLTATAVAGVGGVVSAGGNLTLVGGGAGHNTLSAVSLTNVDNLTLTGYSIDVTDANITGSLTATGGEVSSVTVSNSFTGSPNAINVNGADTELHIIFSATGVNAKNICIYDGGVPIGYDWTYDADSITVDNATGKIKFVTNGDINLNVTNNNSIDGILSVSADTVSIDQVVLNFGALEIENVQPIELYGDMEARGLAFNGPINLNADATLTAVNVSFGTNASVTSMGGNHEFKIVASGNAKVNDITDVGNLIVSGAIITLTGTISIMGDAEFFGVDGITPNDVKIQGDVSISADSLTVGDFQGHGGTTNNLTLEIGQDITLGALSDINNLTLKGSHIYNGGGTDWVLAGTLVNEATLQGITNLTAGGNLTNSGTLTATGTAAITGALTNNAGTIGVNILNVTGNTTNSGTLTVTTNMTASGNITNSGTSTIGGTLTLNGATAQTVTAGSAADNLKATALAVSNNAGVTLGSGRMDATSVSWADANSANITLSGGNLYLGNGGITARPGAQYFATTGTGMLHQQVNAGAATSYFIGSSTGFAEIEIQSAAGTDWVGLRAANGISSYNPYVPTAQIRGLEEAIKLTFTTSLGAGVSSVEAQFADASPAVRGNNFNAATDAVYAYSGGWNKTTLLSGGDFIIANASNVDFRAVGVIDYPTEGWMLSNDSNSPFTPVSGIYGDGGEADPGLFIPIVSDGGFSIGLGSQRGFSFVGSGGDVSNTIGVIPTTGEDGVNIFGGGSYGGEGFGDADYIEEEEYDVFFDDLGDGELPLANVTKHSSFISSYDSSLDAFLAS